MNEIVPDGPDDDELEAVLLDPLLQAAMARQATADRTATRRYRCRCTGVLSELQPRPPLAESGDLSIVNHFSRFRRICS
jgi:hypothetical protein